MSATSAAETGPEPGAWQEELDLSFFADSSMTLPGSGNPGDGCGEWYPKEFCDECGTFYYGKSRCEQRGCPSCWGPWARRRSEKITRRLGAARYAAEAGVSKRAVHAVVSPPEGSIQSLTDVSQGYRDAYQLAKEKGVRGGVAIFHGFRVTEEGKRLFEEAKERDQWDPETDGRLWAFVRDHDRGWRSLTYWSPHWHIIGLARDFEADDPDSQEGWIARRIRSLKPFKLHKDEGYNDMVGAAMYLLSHATFESDTSKDCIRWFGDLATTVFSPEEELSEGSLSVVERKAREAAESVPEGGEKGPGEEEGEECENCGSTSRSPIWEAGQALQDPGWCQRIGREQQRKLKAAFEWAIGDRIPPPGLRGPRTEEEAREAFEEIR